ncbi:sacsin N-terminal ATP-binding-like domain-containing protein [Gordonia sp. CPCC 205333]|uniref:sacsin N-terminal ATP-binding-like domain-containing protein n=1 Tax=Gordonia sp. CPCC 205333 TaxID=3140790 RepID=UPI003AF35EB7
MADSALAADPFGLAALRDSTLSAWRSSPTRLAEDSATEHDLVAIGYRDRLFIELAANAADAATAAGIEGRVSVWLDDERTLVVANTGEALSAQGVASLLAVRVSPKHSQNRDSAAVVGRFGVGFSAVATVADTVEIRSGSGSIVFDRRRAARGADAADAPLLRMAWPIDTHPPAGFDTAVVLRLRDDVDAAVLLNAMSSSVADLLLELPALEQISVGDRTVIRRRITLASGIDEIILDAGQGDTRHWLQSTAPPDQTDGAPGTRWLIEIVDDVPHPYVNDFLRAPTETDIELSLPARCIASVAVTPDRRQLYPGTDIGVAAAGFVELVRAIGPAHRALLIPAGGLARNDIDAALRDAITTALRAKRWVPRAHVADGEDLDIAGAVALVFPDMSTDLGDLIGQVLADLVAPELSETRLLARLRTVGATAISLADLAAELASVQQAPGWWQRVYEALSPYVSSAHDVEELGALPIPRSDGRMNFGARGLFLSAPGVAGGSWLPTVDDAAVHPLLERLGALPVSVSEMLSADSLRSAVEALDDAFDDVDFDDTADLLAADVLALIAADPAADIPKWLAGLPIRDADGELARADELLLPDSPLAQVLVADSPFGMVDEELVARHGVEALRRLGVGWGFCLLHDDLPTGPDHDLPDEDRWWDELAAPPAELWAVRDLDLVAEDRWRDALRLLAADPDIAATLVDADGYTCWWLRTFARIDGRKLACWRAPGEVDLDEVLDVLDHPNADSFASALAQVPVHAKATALAIVEALGDRTRTISPGKSIGAYSALAQALYDGIVTIDDLAELSDPGAVRAFDGTVVGETALVVDQPWLLQVAPPTGVVVVGIPVEPTAAEAIADAFDLRLASEGLDTEIAEPGTVATWSSSVEALSFAAQRSQPVLRGEVRLHDRLTVRVRDDDSTRDVDVSWWIDSAGVTHLQRFTMMS